MEGDFIREKNEHQKISEERITNFQETVDHRTIASGVISLSTYMDDELVSHLK